MIPLWVAAGGALGAAARWGLSLWVQQLTRSPVPWGTLAVNVLGSLALGFLSVWVGSAGMGPGPRAFLTVGVLGGFTTFSSLSYETVALAQAGQWRAAAGYAFGSLVVGVAAVLLGIAAGNALARH